MAKKRANNVSADLTEFSREWKLRREFHRNFALAIAAEAFEDLDIYLEASDDGEPQLSFEEPSAVEATLRLEKLIGVLPDDWDSDADWIDIANSEFNLCISAATSVDYPR